MLMHTVFSAVCQRIWSGFKLVYISWLISTETSLYQSFVFFAEFKCFSLELTAQQFTVVAWSVSKHNTSALVSSQCYCLNRADMIRVAWFKWVVLFCFRFCRIDIKLNIHRTCFIGDNYITIIIVIVLSPSPTSKYICSRSLWILAPPRLGTTLLVVGIPDT